MSFKNAIAKIGLNDQRTLNELNEKTFIQFDKLCPHSCSHRCSISKDNFANISYLVYKKCILRLHSNPLYTLQ